MSVLEFMSCCCSVSSVTILAVSLIAFLLYKYFFDKFSGEKARLQGLVKRKQDERLAEISRLRLQYRFGPERQNIMAMGWETLVKALQARELSAVGVLEAHIAKAIIEIDNCNPVTEFIPAAHNWAKELDDLKEVKGPLHGIPFCVKDDTNVVGMDATLGLAKLLYKPATESAVIVKVLQDLGAIPFCKTNVPQTLFSYDGDNPIFGKTMNGWNNKFGPGGSSSGTAALVAAHGVQFGTGSDIGGSLRIPAHFNGVASIKPTPGRLSLKGSVPPVEVAIGHRPSLGIIAQTPHIVASVFQGMIKIKTQSNYDHLALPIPWDSAMFESKKKLRIGYFTTTPFMPTIGDSGDVVLEAKQALESLGHTLVPFELPDLFPLMSVANKVLLSAIKKQFIGILKYEEISTSAKFLSASFRLPTFVSWLIKKILSCKAIPYLHSRRLACLFGLSVSSLDDFFRAMSEMGAHLREIPAQWEKMELDCLISNVFHAPAPAEDSPRPYALSSPSPYTFLWNMLEYPAGVVPFGKETGNKLNEFNDDGDFLLKIGRKNLKSYIGAPIGVQVIGLPYKEEMVLRIMEELEPFNKFKN